MNSKEFEYNYYFELYKEQPTLVHHKFKREFKKKHPTVSINLDKLIIDIEKYQINKYGIIKFTDGFIEKYDARRVHDRDRTRKYQRFGTKRERKEREMNKKIQVSNNG